MVAEESGAVRRRLHATSKLLKLLIPLRAIQRQLWLFAASNVPDS
jgi:hypothetical protein